MAVITTYNHMTTKTQTQHYALCITAYGGWGLLSEE
jgi:hypothetical protein